MPGRRVAGWRSTRHARFGGHAPDKRSDGERYAQVKDRLCAQIEPLDRTAAILGTIAEL